MAPGRSKLIALVTGFLILAPYFGYEFAQFKHPVASVQPPVLPESDVRTIQELVRRYLFSSRLDTSPIRNLRRFPWALRNYLSRRVVRIEVLQTNKVNAWLNPSWDGDMGYTVEKTSNTWTITSTFFH